MRDVFGIVIVAVVVVAAIVSIVTLLGSRRLYDQIGRGGLSIGDDREERPRPSSAGAALRERDDEIRQLLTAANHRRQARGEAPVDVETELRRLTAPVVDAELRDEVRQLVMARNARREARGEEPLEVEAEVDRQLRELGA